MTNVRVDMNFQLLMSWYSACAFIKETRVKYTKFKGQSISIWLSWHLDVVCNSGIEQLELSMVAYLDLQIHEIELLKH
jgi:hypothetical protein